MRLNEFTETEDRGIATVHPQLRERLPQIYRCRDTILGSDHVKLQGEIYLPKLGNQDTNEYDAYKLRANFLGATERTVSVMVGSLLRKPAEVTIPKKLEYLKEDVTGHGESLEDFIRQTSHTLMGTGRVAILLDRINVAPPDNGIYFKFFPSDQITDWDVDESPGRPRKLVRVVLEEYFMVRIGYRKELRVRYREYQLTNNICTVNFHEQTQEANVGLKKMTDFRHIQFKKGKTIVLKNKGQPLDFIPVTFVSSGQEDNYEPGKPPVLDVADINLSHYRTSADLEHGRHWTALPTPYFTGISEDSNIVIGSGKAMIMADPMSKAGFLEFSGQGLKSLETARIEKEEQMAFLGAKMLTDKSKGSENEEVTRINHSGEIAVLTDLARALSRAITKAFRYAAKWENEQKLDDIFVRLNTDYINAAMSSSDLQSLTSAYQAGAISLDSYLARLQRGEILSEEVSLEDEKEKIEKEQTEKAMKELEAQGGPGDNQDTEDDDDDFTFGDE